MVEPHWASVPEQAGYRAEGFKREVLPVCVVADVHQSKGGAEREPDQRGEGSLVTAGQAGQRARRTISVSLAQGGIPNEAQRSEPT